MNWNQLTRETELAWAAGLYDGEGCTYLRDNKKVNKCSASMVACITQKDRWVLDRFHNAVDGVGEIYWTSRRIHYYRALGISNVQHVLGLLWPYLSPYKQLQAKTVMAQFILLPRRSGTPMFRPIYQSTRWQVGAKAVDAGFTLAELEDV